MKNEIIKNKSQGTREIKGTKKEQKKGGEKEEEHSKERTNKGIKKGIKSRGGGQGQGKEPERKYFCILCMVIKNNQISLFKIFF